MIENINLEDVKKYNASLKQYKEAASKLQAEKEFMLSEIDTACKELSAELGTTVTRENIAEIRESLCNKINSTLQSGNAVLAKIASETSTSQPTPTMETPQTVDVNIAEPVAPVAPVVNNPNLDGGWGSFNGSTLPPMV